jgi:Rrf2 family protein
MAEEPQVQISAEKLHQVLGIPYQYLRQLLKSLTKDGFIKSSRGRSGGYRLDRNISGIFLYDIVAASEGEELFAKCIMGFLSCPFNGGCPMHDIWSNARSNVISILKKTSLNDLINIRSKNSYLINN